MNLVVRASGDPLGLASGVRAAVHEVDRAITVDSARLLDDLVAESLATPRFRALLLASLALLALGLTSFGLAGVVAYSVSRRTPELAIRIAIGAGRAAVLALVMREGLLLGLAGVTLGLGGAFLMTRALAGFLYDVAPTDGVSFLGRGGMPAARDSGGQLRPGSPRDARRSAGGATGGVTSPLHGPV